MSKYGTKTALTYFAFAAVATLISWFALLPVTNEVFINPEQREYADQMAEYRERRDAYNELIESDTIKDTIAQRQFDLVMAGRAEPSTIKNTELRRLASALLKVKSDSAAERTKGLQEMFEQPPDNGALLVDYFLDHFDYGKTSAKGALLTISEGRLANLWSDKPEVVSAAISPEPEALKNKPVPPIPPKANGPLYTAPANIRYGVQWTTLAFSGALAFLLAGLLISHWNKSWEGVEDKDWPNPFTSIPKSLLGWLFILAMLPGYLAIQSFVLTIRLMTSDFMPALAWTGNKLRPKRFANEYERAISELERLETSDLVKRNPELSKRINQARTRIAETKNATEVSRIRVQLIEIEDYAKALEESDKLTMS